MQPPELLEHFRMAGVPIEDPLVRILCRGILSYWLGHIPTRGIKAITYILLLFVNVANLEPYVFLCQGPWRVGHNIFEALWKIVSISSSHLRPIQ
jgi:hypothetical protein